MKNIEYFMIVKIAFVSQSLSLFASCDPAVNNYCRTGYKMWIKS